MKVSFAICMGVFVASLFFAPLWPFGIVAFSVATLLLGILAQPLPPPPAPPPPQLTPEAREAEARAYQAERRATYLRLSGRVTDATYHALIQEGETLERERLERAARKRAKP